jgi:ABC-type sugar transport system substrate-binding protein
MRRKGTAFVCSTGIWILAFISVAAMLVAVFNPARVSELISRNASLFTIAVSYNTIGGNFIRALNRGWVMQGALSLT